MMSGLELVSEERTEDDHRSRDPGVSHLCPFLDRRDAIAERIEMLQRVRYFDRSKAVRVGLHHRDDGNSGMSLERRGITHERAQIHFHPGATQHCPLSSWPGSIAVTRPIY